MLKTKRQKLFSDRLKSSFLGYLELTEKNHENITKQPKQLKHKVN